MSPRSSRPGLRPVAISLCLTAACLAALLACAATARAADYKMLLCAGNNGSNGFQTATNTGSPQNPGGIFSFENYCGPAPDPAGNNAFLRIAETQASGNAGYAAYGQMSWTAPPWVSILAGGGYTREPGSFNDGWRGRFWVEDFGGSGHNILMQGTGVANGSLAGGIGAATTSTFAPHLWPFPAFGSYRRFIFEMTCFRAAGCDRSGWNAVDANTITLILADTSPPTLHLTNTTAPFLGGAWVRGLQTATYSWSELGSGIRMEWVNIDGARNFTIDHAGECNAAWTAQSGEFARVFQPCATATNIGRSDTIDTARLPDGAHTLEACAQDYAQWQGLYGTGGASCRRTTIRTDNTPPGAPLGLAVTSADPSRYLNRFGARFSLPPNAGSPIVREHYYVTNSSGAVVVPQRIVTATNPTSLAGLEGPAAPGPYTLHVALEDEVGFLGAWASAPIPDDTTPPGAPQGLHVLGTTAHRVPSFDVAWTNVPDGGSPIAAAHWRIIDASGAPVGPTATVAGTNVSEITGIQTPAKPGDYKVQVWLQDADGNVGAPATVAVPRDTTPPAAPQKLHVVGTTAHRVEKFDVAWTNIVDDGSPIEVAHWEILDSAGKVAGQPGIARGANIEAIDGIRTPAEPGAYEVRVWLEDGEGNVGAAATVAVPRDTTPPAAPQGLEVVGRPTHRVASLDLRWTDIVDEGSPIDVAHWQILDPAGKVVGGPGIARGANIEAIDAIPTPTAPGNYKVAVWLEDAEGNVGAAATVAVPRDTTPPAAPQSLHVLGTTAHRVERFGVGWTNVVDEGAPITAAHWRIIDGSGKAVGATGTVTGTGVEKIEGIATPAEPGNYRVQVWLEDAEGNVGAAATVAVPRDTTPPAAPQDVSVTPPGTSRSEQGFDLRWRDITDEGSPITAAHYRILGAGGEEVVGETTVDEQGIEHIAELDAPSPRGSYTLLLWLSDAEGNVGAPVRVPLSYGCVRSARGGGSTLTAGLGRHMHSHLLVGEREGAVLHGRLAGPGGGVRGAPVCVFGRVVTGRGRRFLGVAMTGRDGHWRFAIGRGPSRELSVAYRPDQRELTAHATLHVRVRPSFHLGSKVVRNGHVAVFRGHIPGPDNGRVVVVLQVRSGKGWRVFRRYVIHRGRYVVRYRFTRTTTPTTYIMRAEVKDQRGYPYVGGNSRALRLRVMP